MSLTSDRDCFDEVPLFKCTYCIDQKLYTELECKSHRLWHEQKKQNAGSTTGQSPPAKRQRKDEANNSGMPLLTPQEQTSASLTGNDAATIQVVNPRADENGSENSVPLNLEVPLTLPGGQTAKVAISIKVTMPEMETVSLPLPPEELPSLDFAKPETPLEKNLNNKVSVPLANINDDNDSDNFSTASLMNDSEEEKKRNMKEVKLTTSSLAKC